MVGGVGSIWKGNCRPGGLSGRLGVGCLVAATALAAALALTDPAGAGARVIAHERAGAGGTGLGAAAIARAEPRSILRVPGGRAPAYPARRGGRRRASGSIPGRPPTLPSARTEGAPTTATVSPFESNPVTEPSAYPNSVNGKLFGRIRRVGTYSCSASVVRARNRSVIFTAGHCVKEPGRGGWAGRLTFVPAYTLGARPFGRWSWRVVYTTRQWARRGNPNFDYAAVVLKRDHGRRLANLTGSLGFAYGVRRNRTYRAVGYPVNRGAAEQMWECVSSYEGPDPFYRGPGPAPLGIGCDMRAGASGGSWTIAGDQLASVSSFGFIGRPDELYGPRFTKRAERIRRRAGRR
jgi:V8-like Glu-specific endopeptidase